jgi:hypothetical protein
MSKSSLICRKLLFLVTASNLAVVGIWAEAPDVAVTFVARAVFLQAVDDVGDGAIAVSFDASRCRLAGFWI